MHLDQQSNDTRTGVPVCDGRSVYLGVVIRQRLLVSAVDLDGQLRWTRDTGPMSAADGRLVSPRLFGTLVLAAADHPGTVWNLGNPSGHLTAIHRQEGEIIWRIRRRNVASSATPLIAEVAGRSQLILPGPGEIRAYDPGTGDELWFCRGNRADSIPTAVCHRRQVFAISPDPQPMISAIRADGAGDVTDSHVLWQIPAAVDAEIPSLIDRDALLNLSKNGSLTCLDCSTGKLRWRRQLPGSYAVPPVLGAERLLCVNTQGATVMLDLTQRGEIVAEESFQEETHAPLAVTSEQLLLRTKRAVISIPWEKPAVPVVNTPKEQPKRF